MLGRLLGAASSLNPVAKSTAHLESATEEQHTRSLLFPDLTQSQQSQLAPHLRLLNEYDDRGGGLELDVARDFRIIIAQDAIGDQDNPCILLDTKAPKLAASGQAGTSRDGQDRGGVQLGYMKVPLTSHHPPKSPLSPRPFQQVPLSSSLGTFQSRTRSSTLSGPPCGLDSRESDIKDTTRTFLSCMFGSSSAAKTGSSTKMHIISSDPPNASSSVTGSTSIRPIDAPLGDPRRRDPLVRAHTYGTQTHTKLGAILESGAQTHDTVLITRMFNVLLPEAKDAIVPDIVDLPTTSVDTAASYPFPRNNGVDGQKRRKPKEMKTPAFAVAVLVQLPPRLPPSRPHSRHGAQSPRLPRSSESVSSSYGSDLQSSWAYLESMPLSFSLSQTLVDNIDGRVEDLVEHWDVITRSLSLLEARASKMILELLKADLVPTSPHPKPAKEKSMQRTNQINRRLAPWALASSQELCEASSQAVTRIFHALRIPKAVTGIGLARGGPWVEEARSVAGFCGGREQNFFLFNLLTAFLGSHTEWLSLLGPEWYKRRHREQQKSRQDAEPIVSRTVIVCNERSIGRRLVFLLASFLPGTSQGDTSASPLRPGTSFSFKQSSPQSPPLGQISRQHSLRRAINRRARENRLATQGPNKQILATSASSNDGDSNELTFAKAIMERKLQRQGSDSGRSRRTTPMMPIPTGDLNLRKSSAGTTSTVTPDVTTPVAYFSSGFRKVDSYFPAGIEMATTDKSASAGLARHLQQSASDSAALSSEQSTGSTKWGSLLSGVSGLWSSRQNTSSPMSEVPVSLTPQIERTHLHGASGLVSPPRPRNKLEDMANEVGQDTNSLANQKRPLENDDFHFSPDLPQDPPRPKALPLKMKVNENDGVVDVDIQLPGFLSSSFDSGPGSPQPRVAHHTPSLTSLDGLQSSTSVANQSAQHSLHSQCNVAGFLRRYHQDFALQSVRPYSELEAEVRASMLAELTPNHPQPCTSPPPDSSGQWVDVCTTLIADVRSFSIKRLCLKRRMHSTMPGAANDEGPLTSNMPDELTPAVSKASSTNAQTSDASSLEELITTEAVMDLDVTLTDAIERILNSRSHHPSRQPSPSRLHSRNVSSSTTSTIHTQPPPADKAESVKDAVGVSAELPHQESRKMVVSALEEVVKSVSDCLNGNPRGRDIPNDNKSQEEGTKPAKHEENALREGVKKWLISVEHTEVW